MWMTVYEVSGGSIIEGRCILHSTLQGRHTQLLLTWNVINNWRISLKLWCLAGHVYFTVVFVKVKSGTAKIFAHLSLGQVYRTGIMKPKESEEKIPANRPTSKMKNSLQRLDHNFFKAKKSWKCSLQAEYFQSDIIWGNKQN